MLLGFLALLIGQFFGNSIVPIGTKIASVFTGPLPFVLFRFVIGTLLLLLIFLPAKKKEIAKSEYNDFALLGFLLMINVVLFTIAIAYTNVIMSTLIFSLTPLFVGIGAHFLLDESFNKQKLLGLIISFIGLLFLLSQSLSGIQQHVFGQPLGNILIFFSTIGYSFYIIHSRKVLYKKENLSVQTTFMTFAFTTLFILIVVLIALALGNVRVKPLPAAGILGFFIVGICSAIQYLCLQIGIKKTDAFTASLFQYTGPFIAGAVSIPFLHEEINLQLLIGGFFILLGVFIATTYEHLKKKTTR